MLPVHGTILPIEQIWAVLYKRLMIELGDDRFGLQPHSPRTIERKLVCALSSVLQQHDPQCVQQTRDINQQRQHDVEEQVKANASFKTNR